MWRRSQVIGLPVLTPDARRLGVVADLLVNAPDGRVIGLLLAGGNALQGHRIYPYEEVRAIGDGAVIVRTPAALLTTRQAGKLQHLLARHTDLVGKRLITRAGKDLGVIDDLIFHPETGAIAGYQVSGGLMRDVVEGKGMIPVTVELVAGQDAVICARDGDESSH